MHSARRSLKRVSTLLLAPILALVLAAPAAAQYPPPVGSIIPVSPVTAVVGDTVTLSVTVLDPAGSPQPDVTGTFTIVESPTVRAPGQERFVMASVPAVRVRSHARETWNPGGNAGAYQAGRAPFLNPTTATTNANGVATTNLYVGTVPGRIVVEANFGGRTARIVVIVSEAPAPAPVPGVTRLPITGVGQAGGAALDGGTGAALGLGIVALTALLAWAVHRRARTARSR